MAVSIRPMEPNDIPEVSRIEREAFPPPWPPTDLRRDLRPDSLTRYIVAAEEMASCGEAEAAPDCGARVAEPSSWFGKVRAGVAALLRRAPASTGRTQVILGFAGVWFLADEAHLANFAVREECRRRGIGELLLLSIMKLAMEHNAEFVTLEVRASNWGARALYEKCGFVEVGVRSGYYMDNGEDAVLMTADRLSLGKFREEIERRARAQAETAGGASA